MEVDYMTAETGLFFVTVNDGVPQELDLSGYNFGTPKSTGVPPSLLLLSLGAAPADLIRRAAKKISQAKSPVILLGMGRANPTRPLRFGRS